MKEITKQLYCIQMRSGVKIWIEKSKTEKLQAILSSLTGSKFIAFEGQVINSADVVGVFSAETMSDLTHEKNGQWKCKEGEWHDRGERCQCPTRPEKELSKKIQEAIATCGKCTDGWTHGETGMRRCECVQGLIS